MLNFGFVENYQTEQMLILSPAKINIGLYVTAKRDDDYHNINSFFFPLKLNDIMEFIPDDTGKLKSDVLSISGLEIPGDVSNNLILKACHEIRKISSLPFLQIHLHKIIPTGAGLGGGSSNSASILKALQGFADPAPSMDVIRQLSLKLGSDCPFFLNPVSSLAEGRGESLSEFDIDLKGHWIYLFNPGIHVSTKNAYSLVNIASPSIPLAVSLKKPIEQWQSTVKNVFEEPVFKIHPEISEIKNSLYRSGALFASMSGSGSTVFGIFKNRTEFSGSLGEYLIWTEQG